MQPSSLQLEGTSFAAGNATAGTGMSRYASDFIPSGFPRNGIDGTQPTSVPRPASAAVAHAEANANSTTNTTIHSGVALPQLLHTDSAAGAEWRALYGASAAMMAATAGAFRAGSAGVSFMTPIFHLTAHDATILSMEHNNHCKLLGIATSRNEILVTWTQLMPVIENMGTLRAAEDDLFGGEQGPPIDERLLEWDPATMSILIDELPYTCTELLWAPWQQGIYLAGLCPGHGIRIYRYSHGHWALDDSIRTTESTSCAISKHFTIACACSRGRVELWSRSGNGGPAAGPGSAPHGSAPVNGNSSNNNAGGVGAGGGSGINATANSSSSSSSAWVLCRTRTWPILDDDEANNGGAGNGGGGGPASSSAATAGRHRPRDIVGVGWDESGALLAAGDLSGAVHVVSATQDSTRLGEVVFHLPPSDSAGPCRQVAWAPSSGRSFLSLAMVFANCVRVVLFRRPRFMSAAGLPHPGHGGRGGATALSANANSNASGLAAGATLQVLASALVPCEEVAKLSWNGTGTRFVTSHLDSSVNVWAVDVRYQYQSEPHDIRGGGGGGSRSGSGEASGQYGGDGGRAGSTTPAEKRLSLVVSVRRTSSVHPYHAVSK